MPIVERNRKDCFDLAQVAFLRLACSLNGVDEALNVFAGVVDRRLISALSHESIGVKLGVG